MLELELQQYLHREYPQENTYCEWKEFKNLKNSFCGDEKDDVISYVSVIANMEGGHLVIGVHDKTLKIVGTDTYNYDKQKAILRLTERCVNLSTEGLLHNYKEISNLFYLPYVPMPERENLYIIRKSILKELLFRLEKEYH